jgi:acyl-CoA thioester hydrolase
VGWSYSALERSGVGLAVRKLELRFRSPARYEDVIVVRTRIVKVGAASIDFQYELESPAPSGGRPARIAEARTELACIDLTSSSRGPRLLPDDLREALAGLTSTETDRPR